MGTQEEKKGATKLSSNRGRRRLDFKRFQGKAMFLDLPGYRHVARLEEELTERGATLETQFHSGVKYLITMTRNGDSKNPTQSPSTPSPNTPGTAKSSISQLLSPMTDHSLSEATPRQGILTRSQQMLQMSRGRGGRKADLKALALQWGCKVVTLEELLTELKRLKPLPSRGKPGTTDSESGNKIRVLREPFLKVEDLSRLYRPLVLEMKCWPRPLCHASHKASPFDPPQPTKSLQETKPTPAGVRQGEKLENAGWGRGGAMKEKRPGHCECCAVRFEDLQTHLKSARHQEYASNTQNFASLDKLIAQGKSFSQFIYELRSTPPHSTCSALSPPIYSPPQSLSPPASSHPDSVVLVTLPTSHATPTRRRSPRKHPTTPPEEHVVTQDNSTPTNKKRKSPSGVATPTSKSPSAEATPTNKKRKSPSAAETTPIFEVTPTKRLRYSASPDLPAPLKRPRKRSPPSTASTLRGTSGSPASKRLRVAASSSPFAPEEVRRSPRLLMKQLAAATTSSPGN